MSASKKKESSWIKTLFVDPCKNAHYLDLLKIQETSYKLKIENFKSWFNLGLAISERKRLKRLEKGKLTFLDKLVYKSRGL